MKNEQRPPSETPSSGADRGERFAAPSLQQDSKAVRAAIELAAALYFDRPDRVVELRALGVRAGRGTCTASGYFDNAHDFVEAAMKYDGRASGVYATLNIVAPELLARAHNRVEEYAKSTTGDAHVTRRVRFLIDVDPVRASGVSSTNAQLDEARQVARAIVDYLSSLGFPQPALGISGNGAHIIYGIDLPTEAGDLLQRCLQALAFRFNTATITVDETVHKAAQLAKVYGTLACKGDALPDRPHRRSGLKLPEAGLSTVSAELLDQLAATLPRVDAPPRASGSTEPRFDVEQFLTQAGVEIAKSGPWAGGVRWTLAVCPFNPQHTDGAAYVVQFANGALAAGCHHNSCAGKDWRELRAMLSPIAAESAVGTSGSFDGAPQAQISTQWDEPKPVPARLPSVSTVPVHCLPSSLREWLVDVADRMQCPLDYVAIGAIVSLSALLGRKVGIKPQRFDDWLVVANLWGAVVGRPSTLKTPALQEVLRPVRLIERDLRSEHRIQLVDHEAAAIAWEAKRKRLGGRGGGNVSDDVLEGRARQLIDQRPIPPPRPRRVVNDSTVEKLGEILRDNPNGVLVSRDELVGLLRSLDKEGHEEARAFYLEAWDGKGSTSVDRIGRGTIEIPHLIVSVLGGIQPGPLVAYMLANVRSGVGDDGLVQRFQMLVWPDQSPQWSNVDRYPDSDARRRAYAAFHGLESLDARAAGAEFDGEDLDAIPWLRFDDDAQGRFYRWREDLERSLRSGNESEALESHFGKYRKLVPALALIFHLVEVGHGPVGAASLEASIEFSEYLATHARRVYGAALDSSYRTARLLATQIKAGKLTSPFSLRDVYHNCWSGLTDPEEVRRAADLLVEFGWLRSELRRGAGRSATVFLVNPLVSRAHFNGPAQSDAPAGPGRLDVAKGDGSFDAGSEQGDDWEVVL